MSIEKMAGLVVNGLSQKSYMRTTELPESYGLEGVDATRHKPPYVQVDGLTERGLSLLKTHKLIGDSEVMRVKVLQQAGDAELIGKSALYFHVENTEGRDIAEFRLGFFTPM